MASHYEMHARVKSIFIHYLIRLRPINLSTSVYLTTPYDLRYIGPQYYLGLQNHIGHQHELFKEFIEYRFHCISGDGTSLNLSESVPPFTQSRSACVIHSTYITKRVQKSNLNRVWN